jgi:hypothetical protein
MQMLILKVFFPFCHGISAELEMIGKLGVV